MTGSPSYGAGPLLRTLVAAVVVVVLVGLVPTSGRPAIGPVAPASAPAGASALAAAQQSLAQGGGPARGTAPGSPSAAAALPVGPSPRSGAEMVYDAADHYVLLFGGSGSAGSLGDTWTYANGQWTNITPLVSPSPRWNFAMVYDPSTRYVVLFGGDAGSKADTWKFVHGTWTNLTKKAGTPPPNLEGVAMTYDAKDGYVVLFGGLNPKYDAAKFYNETWTFASGRWTEVAPTTAPSPRAYAAMQYDAADGYVLLFGGLNSSGDGNVKGPAGLDDTWTYAAGVWTPLRPTVAPPARSASASTYDPTLSAILLFGGCSEWNYWDSGCLAYLGDTWTWSGGAWTLLAPSKSPGAAMDGALAYDPRTNFALLWPGISAYGLLAEPWKYVHGDWVELALAAIPPPTASPAMAYDAADGYVVLLTAGAPDYGTWTFAQGAWTQRMTGLWPFSLTPGYSLDNTEVGPMAYDAQAGCVVAMFALENVYGTTTDLYTWTYHAGVWQNATNPSGPIVTHTAAGGLPSMAYDPAIGAVVLHSTWAGTSFGNVSDTWLFAGGVWTLMATTSEPPPGFGAWLVYDAADQYLALFGTGSSGVPADTWALADGNWTDFNASGSLPDVTGGAVYFDPVDGYVVLGFGEESNFTLVNTTWTYLGGVWSTLTPTLTPPARTGPGFVWDPQGGYGLLFGGSSWVTTSPSLQESWTFVGGVWTLVPP